MKTTRLCVFLSICIVSMIFPSQSFAEDAREIMRHVIDRDDGTTEIFKQRLSTCRYIKQGKKMVCTGRPRIKVFEGVRKDYGPRERDHKSITIILSPPGERGVGFLQYDYDDLHRETDQWMYLSALGKVKRIVSASESEPKKGSFFGSEIGYEDLEYRRLNDYTYKILQSETYQNRPCWVIESIPTPERARKSNYSKSWSWVDKERFLTLKSILFDRQGRRGKRIVFRQVEQIDGIWIARKMHFNNLQTKRLTTMHLEAIAFNVPVKDNFLTKRTLTDGAFREGKLKELRTYLK